MKARVCLELQRGQVILYRKRRKLTIKTGRWGDRNKNLSITEASTIEILGIREAYMRSRKVDRRLNTNRFIGKMGGF